MNIQAVYGSRWVLSYPGLGKVTRVESHHQPFETGSRGFKSPLVHQKRVRHVGKPVEHLTTFLQKGINGRFR